MMEGGVEDCHLGNGLAEEFARGLNAFDVVRIVKRGEVDTIFDSLQTLSSISADSEKLLTAVHNAVSDGLDIG